jgi:hypothetical protein
MFLLFAPDLLALLSINTQLQPSVGNALLLEITLKLLLIKKKKTLKLLEMPEISHSCHSFLFYHLTLMATRILDSVLVNP